MKKEVQSSEDVKVMAADGNLSVCLPLTSPKGKVRVKSRSFFAEYGERWATRSKNLQQSCYVEWQIGFDLPLVDRKTKMDNSGRTCLSSQTFKDYACEEKFAYELAEVVYHSLRYGLCKSEDLSDCIRRIESIEEDNTFERKFRPTRTRPMEICFNEMKFFEMSDSYPLFVHRFGEYEILSEIVIREQQYGSDIQPMLFLCIPISSLAFYKPVFGRTLEKKECAIWRIGKEEAALALELFNVFGMLSPKHRFDVLQILKLLAPGS